MKSQTEILILGIKYFGFVETESRSSKVRTFKHPLGELIDKDMCLFVGDRASIRVGRNYSNSHAVLGTFKRKLLEAGKRCC